MEARLRLNLPIVVLLSSILLVTGCATKRPVPTTTTTPQTTQPKPLEQEEPGEMAQAVAPKDFPRIPPADANAAWVAPGYRAEVVVRDLIYPTSVEFDDQGNLYVAEAGYSYGDLVSPARIWRITDAGGMQVIADQLMRRTAIWLICRRIPAHRGG